MSRITDVVVVLLALLVCTAGAVGSAGQEPAAPAPFAVAIERHEGTWQARFELPGDYPVWAFERSSLTRRGAVGWRPDSWRVLTPGVTLERIGDFDALVAEDGALPGEVTIAFEPVAVDLQADYDPAVILSNGSLALYSGHFQLFPVVDRAELAALGAPRDHPGTVSMRDDEGAVLYRGEHWNSVSLEGSDYVVFGPVELVPGEHALSILDPGLPDWLASELGSFTARTFDLYTARLGQHAAGTPTLMASWAGPTPETISMGGSVSPNMVTLVFEGEGLVGANAMALERAQWFIAHEAAHFWLGQTVHYASPSDAWIVEGGADLLAVRLQEALGEAAPAPGAGGGDRGVIAQARHDCADLLARGSLQEARLRQEHRAYYACGAVFALAVEQAGAERGEDFFDFVAALIADNPDGEVSVQDWLDGAGRFGVAAEKRERMTRLLEQGSMQGAAEIAALIGPDA